MEVFEYKKVYYVQKDEDYVLLSKKYSEVDDYKGWRKIEQIGNSIVFKICVFKNEYFFKEKVYVRIDFIQELKVIFIKKFRLFKFVVIFRDNQWGYR